MAYYYDVPSPPAHPDTFTEITSPSEGLQHWLGRSTTGTFGGSTQTGDTVVTVKLNSSDTNDGKPVGTARNSWGTDFVCFNMPGDGEVLYAREGRNCVGVFDCNHADRVVITPIPIAATETATSGAASSTASTPSSSSPPTKANDRVLAIALGVSLGTVALIMIGAFVYWKYLRRRRPSQTPESSLQNSDDSGMKSLHDHDDKSGFYQADGSPIYEVNGGPELAEVNGESALTELTGSGPHVYELEGTQDRRIWESRGSSSVSSGESVYARQ